MTERTVNHLKRFQQRKLEDHLVEGWKKIRQRRMNAEQVAGEVTEALGFTISPGNVRSAAKTMELKWAAPHKKKSKPAAVRLRPIILAMVKTCTQLCEQFDLPIPSQFDVFVNRSNKYNYDPVLVEIAKILQQVAPLADLPFPPELLALCESKPEGEPEGEQA